MVKGVRHGVVPDCGTRGTCAGSCGRDLSWEYGDENSDEKNKNKNRSDDSTIQSDAVAVTGAATNHQQAVRGAMDGVSSRTRKVDVDVVLVQQLLDGQLQLQGVRRRVAVGVAVVRRVNGTMACHDDPRTLLPVRRRLHNHTAQAAAYTHTRRSSTAVGGDESSTPMTGHSQ